MTRLTRTGYGNRAPPCTTVISGYEHCSVSAVTCGSAQHKNGGVRLGDGNLGDAEAGAGADDKQTSSFIGSEFRARAFNQLEINCMAGTVVKRSTHRQKLLDEIHYLRGLPPGLLSLFPRVVGYSVDAGDPWLETEYYRWPTLADEFLFRGLQPAAWEKIFLDLRAILEKGFGRHRRALSDGSALAFYERGTVARVAQIRDHPLLKPMITGDAPVFINGKQCRTLDASWELALPDVRALADSCSGTAIHGDFCFSNILYNAELGAARLVDPRGSFSERGIFGDQRYDVAKLYHSTFGSYDFITHDIFRIDVQGSEVLLDVGSPPRRDEVVAAFERVFFSEFDRREILLITALIFARIPALHYDAPERQAAMIATSVRIFADLYPVEGRNGVGPA